MVQHTPKWVKACSVVGNDMVLLAGNKSFFSGRLYRPLPMHMNMMTMSMNTIHPHHRMPIDPITIHIQPCPRRSACGKARIDAEFSKL